MEELVKVTADNRIDGRELHAALGVKTKLNDWINRRVEEYEFVQPLDFTLLKNEYNDIKELWLSLDMAKELCMVEKNERGRAIRKYFIEVENRWRSGAVSLPQTPSEMFLAAAQQMVALEKQNKEVVSRLDNIDSKLMLLSADSEYRTVRALARFLGIDIPRSEASKVGRKAGTLCRAKSIVIGKVPDERDGVVNSYPIHILKPVLEAWDSGIL